MNIIYPLGGGIGMSYFDYQTIAQWEYPFYATPIRHSFDAIPLNVGNLFQLEFPSHRSVSNLKALSAGRFAFFVDVDSQSYQV